MEGQTVKGHGSHPELNQLLVTGNKMTNKPPPQTKPTLWIQPIIIFAPRKRLFLVTCGLRFSPKKNKSAGLPYRIVDTAASPAGVAQDSAATPWGETIEESWGFPNGICIAQKRRCLTTTQMFLYHSVYIYIYISIWIINIRIYILFCYLFNISKMFFLVYFHIFHQDSRKNLNGKVNFRRTL